MKFKYMGIILLGIFLIGFSQINSSAEEEVRFTDMGNGAIRDNDTGLIWLKKLAALIWLEQFYTVGETGT